jgi:putative ABC transport system permease protein
MRLILRIAIRNLQRNFRRSSITVLSITCGLIFILWMQCILAAASENIVDSITSTHIGHLQLFQENYPQTKQLKDTLPQIPEVLTGELAGKGHFTPRMHLPALASSGEQSVPILLEGVDPITEPQVTVLKSRLVEGEYLAPDLTESCDSRQVYIGKSLANVLNVSLGNKIVILAQAADGTLGNELLRVRGIFDTGSQEFDKGFAFSSLNCVKKIGVLSGIHEVTVKLDTPSQDLAFKESLAQKVGPQIKVATWRETLPRMNAIVKFNQAIFALVSTMLFVVITLGIVNTLLVGVFERTREFGVMIALGTAPGQVVQMVLAETLCIGILSSILGTIFGVIAVFYHHQVGFDLTLILGKSFAVGDFKVNMTIFPTVQLKSFLQSVSITMFFVVMAAIYPALRASRLNPVEAMRSI